MLRLNPQVLLAMAFAERLSAARKAHNLTQQQLADRIDLHVTQLRRYEAGTALPNLDVVKRLAVALGATIDSLAFDNHERGPEDELRLQFEAIGRFTADEKKLVRELLDSLILKHEAKRWTA